MGVVFFTLQLVLALVSINFPLNSIILHPLLQRLA